MIERKLEVKLTFIQTDDGTEFKLIVNELQKKGVLYRLTCPHISRKNGVVGCIQREFSNEDYLYS